MSSRAAGRARLPLLSADAAFKGSPDEPPPPAPSKAGVRQLLVLLAVPLAWGTYGPSVKSLYALDAPPPELLFTTMTYVVSSSALALISLLRAASGSDSEGGDRAAAASAVEGGGAEGAAPREEGAEGAEGATRSALLAGFELGAYLFLGSTVQIFGMRYTTVGRAAFIVQLTTVIVPLLEGLIYRRLPPRDTLAACALAFAGVSVLVTSSAADVAGAGAAGAMPYLGDGLVGLAAIFYSLHVVRLSVHAPRLPAIALARAKEVARLIYSSVVLGVGLIISSNQADELAAFVASFASAPAAAAVAVAIVVWNGLVTTAFPTWAQSYGQAVVSAGVASVVYATQPLWSSLFGYLVLGETFGPKAMAGAAAILAAVVLAGTSSAKALAPEEGVEPGPAGP